MSQTPKEDTSPATKADIAAIIEKMDRRFDTVDRRFAAMERQFDERFDAVDRRFDAVDQQFDNMRGWIDAEGRKFHRHADSIGRETRRHIDFTDSSLQRFLTAMLDYKAAMLGTKCREQERRILALERGH
ncbi:MAG: hypothetical protein H8E66_01015 [Planctomycetes bacterium]|nr:hypothetical protein [Planctomycetota bacterium]